MLYQLSYFRKCIVLRCGWRWIRTTVGVSQQIYSLPHLATLVSTLPDSLTRSLLDHFSRIRVQSYNEFYSCANIIR